MDLHAITNDLMEWLEKTLENRQQIKVLFSKIEYDLVYEALEIAYHEGLNESHANKICNSLEQIT